MRENLFSLKRQEQDLSGEHMDLAMQYQTGSISGLAYQAANAKTPEFRFSTEIPTMQAVSQGNTGRCWILAGLNLLREIAVRKMERESLPEGNFLFSPPPDIWLSGISWKRPIVSWKRQFSLGSCPMITGRSAPGFRMP